MKAKVNIIIPAIEANSELKDCLKKLNNISYSNFFVTIILDSYKNKIIKNYKYKLNIVVTGKKNMSFKRNLAVKTFKSKYIAFIDSDAYPSRNWLTIAENYLKKKKGDIVGGPSIPFPKKNFFQKVTYFSKRSYFVTGYQSFRKYKSSARLCDWLESCNIIMDRRFYIKFTGMKESIYTGEDKEFIERIRKKKPNLKVYYSPKLFIYHDERDYYGFLLQRMSFGMDFINLINPSIGIKGFQPLLPLTITLLYLTSFIYFFSHTELNDKIIYLFGLFFIICSIVLLEIINYVRPIKMVIPTLFTILLANIFFALGGFFSVFGLRRNLLQTLYRKSRNY